jgi:hypothetical protein
MNDAPWYQTPWSCKPLRASLLHGSVEKQGNKFLEPQMFARSR